MSGVGRQQLYGALIFLVAALFVLSGLPPAARWRQRFRHAAIALYVAAAAVAVIGVVLWLLGAGF